MSIKSESIAIQLFLAMDEAIEKKDLKAFMKAMKNERLHNCVVGNEQVYIEEILDSTVAHRSAPKGGKK